MSQTLAQRASDAEQDRLLAYLIDFGILSAGAFVLWLISFVINMGLSAGTGMAMDSAGPSAVGSGSFLATALLGIVVNAVLWLAIGGLLVWYFVYYASDGETFGKQSQDVAVVDEHGEAPSKKQRWIRTGLLLLPFPVMAFLGALLGGIGFVLAVFIMVFWLFVELAVLFLSDDGQRLGDRLADTYVVDDAS